MIEWCQKHGQVEGACVLHGATHHKRVVDNLVGVTDCRTPRVAQRRHIGKLLAGKADCERTKRVHPGLLDTPAALADHMHHGRRINHGVGIRGHTDAGNPSGICSREFALHGGFVLFARFAKTCLKIDQSGTDDTACRINFLISGEIIPCCSRVDNKTLVDE